MTISRIIIGIILACGSCLCLFSCNNKPETGRSPAGSEEPVTPQKIYHTKENTYEGLRNMAFSVTPAQLGLSREENKTVVYGVIMDWGMDKGVATLVTYQTGDASLYLSSGGGVIGGGQHARVNAAAKKFVDLAQHMLEMGARRDSKSLPEMNEVNFYLLTNKGIYLGQSRIDQFKDRSSRWLALFEEANTVITELRLTTDRK